MSLWFSPPQFVTVDHHATALTRSRLRAKLWFTLAAASAALLCGVTSHAADKFERLCVGANDGSPVFLTRDSNGTIERIDVFLVEVITRLAVIDPLSKNAKVIKAKYEKVHQSEIDEVCRSGISVAVMPKPDAVKDVEGHKTVIAPLASLPSSFTIQTRSACMPGSTCTVKVLGFFGCQRRCLRRTMPNSRSSL
jgi:hypothetical protein